MRPPAAATIDTVGSFGSDTRKIHMGIDPENFGHIFSMLTDIYGDTIMACIREYSTNAWDGHVKAGRTARPIEVTLPNALSPFFIVQDFGTGMDEDTMADVFSNYGSSTKRDEDISNGQFGIGGKAALTYTNQFTVVSVKDGIQLTALVSRITDIPEIEIIDTRVTDAPNGVRVSVPVNAGDSPAFAQKAEYFYSFWQQGTVLVNGSYPKKAEFAMVTDTIGTVPTTYGHDIVVMGNVPYPVERRLYDGRGYYGRFDIIAFVEIGDVIIPPNRESLIYKDKTDKTIERIKQEFTDAIRQTIAESIEDAPNTLEAYNRMVSWESTHGLCMPEPVLYKGNEISRYKVMGHHALYAYTSDNFDFSKDNSRIRLDNYMKGVVIKDFKLKNMSKTHKMRAAKWAQDNGITAHGFWIVDEFEQDPWIDPSRVVSFETIKSIVLPKDPKTGSDRAKPKIEVYEDNGRIVSITDLDENKTPLYISPTSRIASREALRLYSVFPDVQIVVLGQNRWDKFKRDNPKAVPLKDFIQGEYNKARDALTASDVEALSVDAYSVEVLRHLDHEKIDDPTIRAAIKFSNGSYQSDTVDRYKILDEMAYRYWITRRDFQKKDYLSKFPLLRYFRSDTMSIEHTHLYLNAVYAASV